MKKILIVAAVALVVYFLFFRKKPTPQLAVNNGTGTTTAIDPNSATSIINNIPWQPSPNGFVQISE